MPERRWSVRHNPRPSRGAGLLPHEFVHASLSYEVKFHRMDGQWFATYLRIARLVGLCSKSLRN